MQTKTRAYNSTNPANYEIEKGSFTDKFMMLLESELNSSDEYQRIVKISDKLNTKSKDFVKEAIRRAIIFEFRTPDHEHKHNVIMKIRMNLIKDMFANGLDNVVIGEARRKADGSPHLRLISEMYELTGQISWGFQYNSNSRTVSNLRPAQLDRRDKTKALCQLMEKILFKLQAVPEARNGDVNGKCRTRTDAQRYDTANR